MKNRNNRNNIDVKKQITPHLIHVDHCNFAQNPTREP